MLVFAVCDDDEVYRNKIIEFFNYMNTYSNETIRFDIYNDAATLLARNLLVYDAFFLDVEIGEDSGIECARIIREKGCEAQIIFVSNYIRYAPAGYKVKAFAYIEKSEFDIQFEETVDDLLKEIFFQKAELKIDIDGQVYTIVMQNLIYIESQDKKLILHIKNSDYLILRMKLDEMEELLSGKNFLRIQKSFLVNIAYIIRMKNYVTYLFDGTELPASRQNWAQIHKEYMDRRWL